MNCPDCGERLQQWLDARTRGGAATPDGPRLCPACAEWGAAARRFDHGLRLLAAPTPPTSLADRIVAGVASERRRGRMRMYLAAGVAAMAATVLLAVWLQWHKTGPAPVAPTEPPAVVHRDEPTPETPPTLGDSVAQARSAVEALTARTADETMAQTKMLMPGVPSPSLGSLDLGPTPLDSSGRSLRETGEGVTAGLEPVADSARRAVGLFLRELPPVEAGPKTGF